MAEVVNEVRSRQLGLLTSSSDPILIDSVAEAGMDFLWLDAEYTGLSAIAASHVVHRLSGRGVSTLIRVPAIDPDSLVTFANMGFDEIVLPRVRTVEEIKRAWTCLTYPPRGERPRQVIPASAWGARYDRQPQISMIVETLDAVRALPQIIATDHLSSYWIGHKDLFDDYVREFGDKAGFEDFVREIVETFRQSGVSFGWGVPEPSDVESVWTAGATRCAWYWDLHLPRHLARSAASRLERR
ncbi:aldolase/citrate lyase family protein [Nonomuraea cavernae]|uniref:aldolase/citrate lyase family protein n=1 Tax=Nonomuraea cavernae TaxID=2045107 RepID=UPI0033F55927